MSGVYIIGNGPSATRAQFSNLGHIIDKAEVVVRLNDFQTKGFEAFVGTKTDILFTCRLNEYVNTIDQFPEVILCLLMNPLEGVKIPDHVLNSPNITRVIQWPEVTEWTLNMLGLAANCYPSTGLLCVLTMVKRFGHVNVVGFDHFQDGNRHYYESGRRKVPRRHDGPGEAKVLNLLNFLGLLTYAQDLDLYKYDGHAANL
jgi:hypothetical protein